MKKQKDDDRLSLERAKMDLKRVRRALKIGAMELHKISVQRWRKAAADFIEEDPRRLAKGWKLKIDKNGMRVFTKGRKRIVA